MADCHQGQAAADARTLEVALILLQVVLALALNQLHLSRVGPGQLAQPSWSTGQCRRPALTRRSLALRSAPVFWPSCLCAPLMAQHPPPERCRQLVAAAGAHLNLSWVCEGASLAEVCRLGAKMRWPPCSSPAPAAGWARGAVACSPGSQPCARAPTALGGLPGGPVGRGHFGLPPEPLGERPGDPCSPRPCLLDCSERAPAACSELSCAAGGASKSAGLPAATAGQP